MYLAESLLQTNHNYYLLFDESAFDGAAIVCTVCDVCNRALSDTIARCVDSNVAVSGSNSSRNTV